jgi:hypothetical protein
MGLDFLPVHVSGADGSHEAVSGHFADGKGKKDRVPCCGPADAQKPLLGLRVG